MLFRLAPYRCCLALFGPGMNNIVHIQQVFNPNVPRFKDTCQLISKFVKCKFVAYCDASFEGNIREGILNQQSGKTKQAMQAFFISAFKSRAYMGPQDGVAFEALSILDKPCHPRGPKNANTKVVDLAEAES